MTNELLSERKEGKKERKSFLNQKEEWRKNFGNSLQFMCENKNNQMNEILAERFMNYYLIEI